MSGTELVREKVERKTLVLKDGAVVSRLLENPYMSGDYRRDVLALCDRIDELEAENAELRKTLEIVRLTAENGLTRILLAYTQEGRERIVQEYVSAINARARAVLAKAKLEEEEEEEG